MPQPFTEICYVVHDMEAAIAKWSKSFGAGPFFTIESEVMLERTYRGQPAQDAFTAAIGYLGTTVMEFIQPRNDKPSIFREILDSRGEAVHHILPRFKSHTPQEYDAAFNDYVRQGFEPAATLIVPGFGRNAFFDAVSQFGFFIELLEVPPQAAHVADEMYQAHLTWDGRNPIRPLR